MNCIQCAKSFNVTPEDKAAIDRLSPVINGQKIMIPDPKLCPDCRQQRRLAFRNERVLHHRSCDRCKKEIISVYSADKLYTVYCSECWWGDNWDPLEYGQEVDFNRPFFDQIKEITRKVPLLSNMVFNSENSEFNGFCVDSKNCYMSSRVGDSEDIYYSYLALHAVGCFDCFDFFDSQYCYGCVDCWNCYNAKFCQLCRNTSDSAFCYDCIGCKNCFGCVSLRNVEYHFFNQPCSKEEYEKKVKEWNLGSRKGLNEAKNKFRQTLLKKPFRATIILNSQNVSGNYITNSKDIHQCFDVEKTDSSRYSWGVEYSKDIYDCDYIYYGENCYENMANSKSSNIRFSFATMNVHDLMYCMLCFNNSGDCFGSISLKQKKYCILNKQYTKEEYERLVPKIIEHMRKNGEWGEFFPMQLSLFGYNETLVQEYFPLTKQQVEAKGWLWKDEDSKMYNRQTYQVPDDIKDVSETIIKEVLACVSCGKNFKIIAQELKFYREKNLAIPEQCPECRHRTRIAQRSSRTLYDRTCAKCGIAIQTTFAPDRPETVYCEKCYLETVY